MNRINASLLAVIIALSMISVMPTAMAYDHDQTYDWNAAYFIEEDIRSPSCGTETVDIWVNMSVPIKSGRVVFEYDPTCANVASFAFNTNWTQGMYDITTNPGRAVISPAANPVGSSYGPGPLHLGTFTIECLGGTGCCCGTNLSWVTSGTWWSYLNDAGGNLVTPVNYENGTFLCGDGIDVEKTVWDESTSSWVDPLTLDSSWMGKDVIFNITVTAKCLDLSNVMVFDVMDGGLTYNYSDTPPDTHNTTHTANWTTLGQLLAYASTSLEFNATIDGYGPQDNTATATATVDDLAGLGVQASDTATVDTCPPAGLGVNKTVWDGSAWVELINGATIGDTYRFRVEVTNTGSPTMNVCDMIVWDVLPSNLAYADSAKLQDHHGVWWDLTLLDINDPANNTYGWIINNTVPGECLQPAQKIVIEYDATVTNYGLGCNNMTAKGFCAVAGQWVQGNDSACIDVPKPDLNVTDIEVNYDATDSSVNNHAIGPVPHPGNRTQPNNISATIAELNGIDVEFPFDVTIEISTGGIVIATDTVQVPAVMAGSSTVVVTYDELFYPLSGVDYTINVTADSAANIPETDENNNMMSELITGEWHGYKGSSWQGPDKNITKMNCDQGNINVVYSAGDSYYLSKSSTSGNPHWTTYEANWTASDIPIPTSGATIKKARLYVYYCWDATPSKNITNYFTLDFNGYVLPIDKKYYDAKSEGSGTNFGVAAYDVTHKVSVVSNNTATLTNSYLGGGNAAMSAMLLTVVYEHPDEPERTIWINEGADILGPSNARRITSEEATSYAPFEDCYPIPSTMGKATLFTVAPWATDGGDKNRMLFNDGIWKGIWNAYPPTPTQHPWRSWVIGFGSPQLGMNETDVSAYLKSSDNTAGIQSHIPDGGTSGDWMCAANAILIVEKQNPEMSVEPEPPASGLCYDVGEEFDVLINITPRGVPIRGAQFDLNYDGSVIVVDNFELGGFLDPPVSIDHQSIDNAAGVASFAASMTSGTHGMIDPGTFVIVRCMAVGQGANTSLTLTDAVAYDNTTPIMQEVLVDVTNSSVEVCDNTRPIPVPMSKFTYNNMADIIVTKAYFDGTDSTDPDGIITLYTWWFGDGATGVGPTPEHTFEVRQYWNSTIGDYVPANVTLIVTDDGMPLMDNRTHIDVTVWIGGDANGDGRVNIGDSVMVGYYWGSPCNTNGDGLRWYDNPPADMADLNNDEKVNIGDSIPVGYCWGHTAW